MVAQRRLNIDLRECLTSEEKQVLSTALRSLAADAEAYHAVYPSSTLANTERTLEVLEELVNKFGLGECLDL